MIHRQKTHIINNVVIPEKLIKTRFSCCLDRCCGACCRNGEDGAPVTQEELVRISQSLDLILPLLPQENQRYLALKPSYYRGFDGRFLLSMMPVSGDCVFAVRQNKTTLCSLQSVADSTNPDLKPISCRLFPIRVVSQNSFLILTTEFYDECPNPSPDTPFLLDFCREPLRRRFGDGFIHQMDGLLHPQTIQTDSRRS